MPTKAPAIARDSTLRVEPLGDRALLAVLGEGIDPGINDQVHKLAAFTTHIYYKLITFKIFFFCNFLRRQNQFSH